MKRSQFIFHRPKYGNIKQTVDGISFDSKKEADYYVQLKIEKKAKLIMDFERQVSFELRAWQPSKFTGHGYSIIGRHVVDFLITNLDGSKEIREVKGYATPLWDYKRKVFESNYPDIKYRVVR